MSRKAKNKDSSITDEIELSYFDEIVSSISDRELEDNEELKQFIDEVRADYTKCTCEEDGNEKGGGCEHCDRKLTVH